MEKKFKPKINQGNNQAMTSRSYENYKPFARHGILIKNIIPMITTDDNDLNWQ